MIKKTFEISWLDKLGEDYITPDILFRQLTRAFEVNEVDLVTTKTPKEKKTLLDIIQEVKPEFVLIGISEDDYIKEELFFKKDTLYIMVSISQEKPYLIQEILLSDVKNLIGYESGKRFFYDE